MKKFAVISMLIVLTGCSSIKQYWPRDHDPVLFNHLVTADLAVEHVNCEQPDWAPAHAAAEQLSRYAEWRSDPQTDNLIGLLAHTERMSHGGSRAFCELGRKTAQQRIEAARTAWKGR